MNQTSVVIGLDVGTKRVGIARANTITKFPQPYKTLDVTDQIFHEIADIIEQEGADTVVIGLPRNMSGEETQQTKLVRDFCAKLNTFVSTKIVFQDETLSSVAAEERLGEKAEKDKSAIDAMAAVIILEDYLKV